MLHTKFRGSLVLEKKILKGFYHTWAWRPSWSCDQHHVNRGIKHDFPFINIRKVPREVLKTEGEARGFQPSLGTLRMLMNDKIRFDRYYCINSTKHCENDENIGALYYITSSHFPKGVRYV